jgi:hypothetical protein
MLSTWHFAGGKSPTKKSAAEALACDRGDICAAKDRFVKAVLDLPKLDQPNRRLRVPPSVKNLLLSEYIIRQRCSNK